MNDTPAIQTNSSTWADVGMHHLTSKSIWNLAVINRKAGCKLFHTVGPKQLWSNPYMSVTSKIQWPTPPFFSFFSACVPREAHLPGLSCMWLFHPLFTNVQPDLPHRRLQCRAKASMCVYACACAPTRQTDLAGTDEITINVCLRVTA